MTDVFEVVLRSTINGEDTNLSQEVSIVRNSDAAAAHNHSHLYPAV